MSNAICVQYIYTILQTSDIFVFLSSAVRLPEVTTIDNPNQVQQRYKTPENWKDKNPIRYLHPKYQMLIAIFMRSSIARDLNTYMKVSHFFQCRG